MFYSQEAEIETEKKTYIKANAVFIPIGMINAGVETQLSEKYTLQGDFFYSPWKSIKGHEANFIFVTGEPRYYFKEAFRGFYVGANLTFARFKIQKWNYWDDVPAVDEETGEPLGYLISDLYQKGFSIMFGATVGYQFRLSEKWNMDIFGGFGNSQDFYKGYNRETGERYDKASGYNRSAEWIPYRGGIMIAYKFK